MVIGHLVIVSKLIQVHLMHCLVYLICDVSILSCLEDVQKVEVLDDICDTFYNTI